jgi:GT2 family glycosyltransferase
VKVSIIIPTWNGKALLERNLPFLFQSIRLSHYPVEVIVVDDGGEDGSQEFLADKFPRVKVVVHRENRGFSKACLSGAKAAQGEVIILLNNDVTVCNNFIDPLITYFKREDTFSVSPLVLDEEGNISSVSLRIPYLRRGKMKFRKTKELILGPRYTLFGSGGSVAYSRKKFLLLGGFNSLYSPFYLEDRELGLRAWRRGWRSYLEPRVKVIHPKGQTINNHFPRKFISRIKQRNEIIFSFNNVLNNRLLITGVVFPLLMKLFYKWINLHFDYYLSFFSAIRALPEIQRQRKEEKKSMVLNEEEIFKIIKGSTPEINNHPI